MRVFLVRSIETKAFEGVFWAERLADLWDTFDQFGDPFGYEYAALQTAGAICVGMGQVVELKQWDNCDDEDDLEELDWGAFQADEMLTNALYGQNRLRWRPFCAADEDYGLLARIADQLSSVATNDNEPALAAA
jgi:hypothetical protein